MIYFTAHTFKCVCHCRRAMFRVLGMYNFAKSDKKNEKKGQLVRVSFLRSDFLQNPYFNKQNGKRGNDLDQFQNGLDNSDEVNDGYRNGIHDADDEKLPLQNSYHQDEPTVTQLCYNSELNSKRPASQILMDDMKETERKNPKNRTIASEKVSANFV